MLVASYLLYFFSTATALMPQSVALLPPLLCLISLVCMSAIVRKSIFERAHLIVGFAGSAVICAVALSTLFSGVGDVIGVFRIYIFFVISMLLFALPEKLICFQWGYRSLFLVLVVTVILSVFQFWCFQLDIKPFNSEYFNSRDNYTVIFFGFLGDTYLRLPGLFESGKSNSSFVTVLVLVAYFVRVRFAARIPKLLSLFLIICLVICVLGFTRRPLVAFVATIIFSEILISIERGSLSIILVSGIVLSLVSMSVFFGQVESYFSMDSLIFRVENWVGAIESLSSSGVAMLFGGGYLQESEGGNVVTDNMFLSFLMFGGVSFFLLATITIAFLGYYGASCFFRSGSKEGLLLASLVFYLLFSGMLGNVWSNFGEAFVFYIMLPLLYKQVSLSRVTS